MSSTIETAQLPSYSNPPVIEVLVAVQFEPMPNFDTVRLGLLWERLRKEFPNVEQKPPLAPFIERLGVRAPLNKVQFQVGDDFGVPRMWFVTEGGDDLIQIQGDRFIRNWRLLPNHNKPYPRYMQHIRPRFEKDYQIFKQFLLDEGVGELIVNQCEVTYINHIEPNEHWSSHKELQKVFRGWNSSYTGLLEYDVESINARVAHLMRDEAGEFLGRLHVTLQSAFRPSQNLSESDQPIFLMTLTARGRPVGVGDAGVLGFLDAGRKAIVSTFDTMTTPEMHKAWGKEL